MSITLLSLHLLVNEPKCVLFSKQSAFRSTPLYLLSLGTHDMSWDVAEAAESEWF